MKNIFLSFSDLKRRGWTEKIIKTFLPTPDETRENPYYSSAAPMKLYEITKVESIEKSKEFIEAMKKAESRKKGAQKAVESKKAKTMEWVEKLKVKLYFPNIKMEKLRQEAIDHYECYHDTIIDNYHPDFICRITMNYLRHKGSNYDNLLERLSGVVGKEEAYEYIKKKVNDTIKENYTWLQDYEPIEDCQQEKVHYEYQGFPRQIEIGFPQ